MVRRNADQPNPIPTDGLPAEILAGPEAECWDPGPQPVPGCSDTFDGASAPGQALARAMARHRAWSQAGEDWSEAHGVWWSELLPDPLCYEVGIRGRQRLAAEALGGITRDELIELEWIAHRPNCRICAIPDAELPPRRKPRTPPPTGAPVHPAPRPDPGSGASFFGDRF